VTSLIAAAVALLLAIGIFFVALRLSAGSSAGSPSCARTPSTSPTSGCPSSSARSGP